MLSCIVEEGDRSLPLDRFLKTTLFRRMGIREFAWERCPLEHTMGATGCYMGLEDLNKIGRLYALGGSYEGRRCSAGNGWKWPPRRIPTRAVRPMGSASAAAVGGFLLRRGA